MKLIALSATLLTFWATQAIPLSCMEANMAQRFIWAKEASDNYVIVKGKMRVDKASKKTLSKDSESDSELFGYRARIAGQSLSKQGFASRFTSPVTVELSCFHGWCGNVPDARERIYFLKKKKNRYIKLASPCDFSTESTASPENIRILQSCISGGPCKP